MTKEKMNQQDIDEKLIEYDQPDRLGIYVGDLRVAIGIPQPRLAEGLCSEQQLANIELGNREADKLLTDAMLQRLGKPADLFIRILEDKEVWDYRQRKWIIKRLQDGELKEVEKLLTEYGSKKRNVLEQQFMRIVELNLMYLRGTEDVVLYESVLGALKMTQPRYGELPISDLLLTRNEGYLLMALLQLKEKLYGEEGVTDEWRELLEVFRAERYESAERVYLAPFVAYHVAVQEYEKGNLGAARDLCTEMLQELQEEQCSYCQQELLELAGRIAARLGQDDREYRFLAEHLAYMKEHFSSEKQELWIPYEEGDNVHSMSEVIKGRRNLLGKSRELLAGPINPATLYRIEEKGNSPQKRVRRYLLEHVGLSGERYDYEIITGRYEDYLLRSKLGRAVNQKRWDDAMELLAELRGHTPDTTTNRQYLMMVDACICEQLSERHRKKISLEERILRLWDALRLTLPVLPKDVRKWEEYEAVTLSVNEIQVMKQLAAGYRRKKMMDAGLQILLYVKKCMELVDPHETIDVEGYTLCMRTLVSMLGDMGRYEESNDISEECIRLILSNNATRRTTGFLYNILWNMEQELRGLSDKEKVLGCRELFLNAYAAAKLSKDKVMLQHIEKHANELYENVKLF